MISLDCKVQKYDWGKRGSKSAVARLKSKSNSEDFNIDEDEPYAELWMGTHPSGPAMINESDEPLLGWLSSRPTAVGRVPKNYRNNDLPFMFKVLSIKTALSVQAHPDKQLAEKLHLKWPAIYKDSNHKPEMAIAITPFQAMCGFRPIEEIKKNLKNHPELRTIIGKKGCDQFERFVGDCTKNCYSDVLRTLFTAFMECEDALGITQVNLLINRLTAESLTSALFESKSINKRKTRENSICCDALDVVADEAAMRALILHLHTDYPNDLGALCPLLLNCLFLSEGEAFFMGSNEPHAYVSGDIVEIMALSDNVVRAGLTPKFKDVKTLCDMLHYGYGKPSSFIRPVPLDKYTLLYRPPPRMCAEFEVERCNVPPNADPYHPSVLDCGYLLLIFSGNTSMICEGHSVLKPVKMGSVLFVSANSDITVVAGSDGVVFYRAHINLGDSHMCPHGY